MCLRLFTLRLYSCAFWPVWKPIQAVDNTAYNQTIENTTLHAVQGISLRFTLIRYVKLTGGVKQNSTESLLTILKQVSSYSITFYLHRKPLCRSRSVFAIHVKMKYEPIWFLTRVMRIIKKNKLIR